MPDGTPPAQYTIGSGDAKHIMAGRRGQLWRIKKGIEQPEDLTWKMPVQMGLLSEDLNRRFYQYDWSRTVVPATAIGLFNGECRKVGIPCTLNTDRNPPAYMTTHRQRSWQVCHLDGLVEIDGVLGIWEGKHTDAISPWNREERVVEHNWWQFVHQMSTNELPWVEVSVIYGNGNDRKVHRVHRDMDEEAILLAAEMEFLEALRSDKEPPDEQPVTGANDIGVGGQAKWTKKYTEVQLRDLPCANEFPQWAADYLESEGPARRFEAAKKALKEAMPEDAFSLTAHGVVVKRNVKGAINITKDKEKANASG
jgi:hypothetical protein